MTTTKDKKMLACLCLVRMLRQYWRKCRTVVVSVRSMQNNIPSGKRSKYNRQSCPWIGGELLPTCLDLLNRRTSRRQARATRYATRYPGPSGCYLTYLRTLHIILNTLPGQCHLFHMKSSYSQFCPSLKKASKFHLSLPHFPSSENI